MRPVFRSGVVALVTAMLAASAAAQASKPGASSTASSSQRAATLAESGHCAEALPLLSKAIHQVSDRDLKKRIGLDGLHCAMTHNAPNASLPFLEMLGRDFPNDPDVLYATTHAYSDLSVNASNQLMREAPFSYQVHELRAEALESQGKWDEAIGEYRKILEINPLVPGIHARIGRALLAKGKPTPEVVEEVKKNFEAELEIDPNNASAEYVLGELALEGNDSATAIRHLTRATKLDAGFSDAFLALGMAFVSAKRFAEAIPPLETYEKSAPDSPTGHFQLAQAYAGVGRKDDANREAALQRQSAEALEQAKRKVALGMDSGKEQPQEPK
ncbi:MAG TPA: tetratricopeptide repeat protein [Candidatus Sulfotelmatobacter sp.]|nr:tetratricopeptide repeat protein [Candidatus Sulfotelmatobacter sp.]